MNEYKEATTLESTLLENLLPLSSHLTVERGEYLIHAGEVENNIYIVESGAVRAIYQSEHDEHTIRFGYEGSIINSLSSFITGEPSEFYIQAIRKSELQVVEKSSFEALLAENPEFVATYNEILKELVTQQMEREIDLLTYSPKERLRRVQERSPKLFQEVPSKYIASYLRMSPETLSRVMGK